MPGQLFTQYFLTDGIKTTPAWKRSEAEPGAFNAFQDEARQRCDALNRAADPNEALTEQRLVRPLLEALGWPDYLPQQGLSPARPGSVARNEDIPDHLLFADAASRDRAAAHKASGERYREALVVQESKRFGLPLDARDSGDRAQPGTPHGQILRYLETARIASDGRIRWGMLTNGRVWRLYDGRAPAATTRPPCTTCCSRAGKTTCGSSTCCFAAMPSCAAGAPPAPFWKTPWKKAGATKSRWRATSQVSFSSASSRGSRRPLLRPAAAAWPTSVRPP